MLVMSHRNRTGKVYHVRILGANKSVGRDLSLITDIVRTGSYPLAERIRAKYEAYRNVEKILYVSPGATIRPPLPLLERNDWDVAAHVQSLSPNLKPMRFSGVGKIWLATLAFRRTEATRRVLDRWVQQQVARPEVDPAVALAIALTEIQESRILHLPEEYVVVQGTKLEPGARPLIEHVGSAPPEKIRNEKDVEIQVQEPVEAPVRRRPECVMVGHFSQYTGYGKAGREVLFRLANAMTVHLDDSHKEPVYIDQDLQVRIDAHKGILVGPRAPLLRIMGPDYITGREGWKIVWTMQETARRVHADMVKRANQNFNELWTPSQWNVNVFRDSGVEIPCRVMRLGVNPSIFRPLLREPLPPCRLISTSRRGLVASPQGFVFLTVGLPGFRKGWDVVADAFAKAFAKRRDVHLVIGLTHSPKAWNEKVYKQFANYKVPIWTLEGSFEEHALARIYSSVDAYVSASRGEGFNLPAMEAAACGRPVIVPGNTCHPELFGPHAYIFDCEGERVYPEGDWISEWYKGQLFANFGKKSIAELAEIMQTMNQSRSHEVAVRADALRRHVVSSYTWDAAASAAAARLLEVQP